MGRILFQNCDSEIHLCGVASLIYGNRSSRIDPSCVYVNCIKPNETNLNLSVTFINGNDFRKIRAFSPLCGDVIWNIHQNRGRNIRRRDRSSFALGFIIFGVCHRVLLGYCLYESLRGFENCIPTNRVFDCDGFAVFGSFLFWFAGFVFGSFLSYFDGFSLRSILFCCVGFWRAYLRRLWGS